VPAALLCLSPGFAVSFRLGTVKQPRDSIASPLILSSGVSTRLRCRSPFQQRSSGDY